MEEPRAKRMPKLVLINDPVEFCKNKFAGMFTIYFFNMHFDEWNQAAPLPEPRVFEPGSSVCRRYFEEVFPGNTFKHNGVDAQGNAIRSSAELIDIFAKGRELYFFKARSPGFRKVGPDLNKLLLASLPVEVAVQARPVSKAFEDAGRARILNRLELNYPVTFGYTPEQTEAVVQGINATIMPVLNKYELVRELELNVEITTKSFQDRLELWPEMYQLLNMTHTLTFHKLYNTRSLSSGIDYILNMHPRLKIVITWLVVNIDVSLPKPTVDPNRVYVQNLVLHSRRDDAEPTDRIMSAISLFSNHVARVMPLIEHRDGVSYQLSFDTGRYE
jgi:hypothetical protein